MTSASDRKKIVSLIDEAMAAGARQFMACAELGLDARTLPRRETPDGSIHEDRPLQQRDLAPPTGSLQTSGIRSSPRATRKNSPVCRLARLPRVWLTEAHILLRSRVFTGFFVSEARTTGAVGQDRQQDSRPKAPVKFGLGISDGCPDARWGRSSISI
jgi:hypothetical protein